MAKRKPALKTDTPQPIPIDLYTRIAVLISQARQNIVKNIDYTMVYTHFEIGRMIMEDEQRGNAKAAYGAKTLKDLSIKLSANFGKGFSERNLEQKRKPKRVNP
jgi:hypothetical protein